MHRLAVGEPYLPGQTRFPELAQWNYRASGHELVLFFSRPSSAEIEAVAKGPSEFALFQDRDIAILLYRFRTAKLAPAIDWSDAPFSIWRLPESERTAPPRGLAADERALLTVILVDAATGIVRAIRAVSWSPELTAHVHAAITDQLAMGGPAPDYDRRITALLAANSATALLTRAVGRSTGGGQ